jgi:hypothetical protein
MAKRIPEVENAKETYGIRHFRYPIDVVNHENALQSNPIMQFEPEHRLTCGHCKKFSDKDHIVEHHTARDAQGKLF